MSLCVVIVSDGQGQANARPALIFSALLNYKLLIPRVG